MLWLTVPVLYTCISLAWVRWRFWSIFFWPLHLIVSDENPQSADHVTFRKFAQREFSPEILVPFSVVGPLFVPISILCWAYLILMFIAVRLWINVRALWPQKAAQTQTEG